MGISLSRLDVTIFTSISPLLPFAPCYSVMLTMLMIPTTPPSAHSYSSE
jgi:hypothetical protein